MLVYNYDISFINTFPVRHREFLKSLLNPCVHRKWGDIRKMFSPYIFIRIHVMCQKSISSPVTPVNIGGENYQTYFHRQLGLLELMFRGSYRLIV